MKNMVTFSIAPESAPTPFPSIGYCLDKCTAPFSWAWPCPKYPFAASTPSPTPARSCFPSRHWEGSFFCVFHGAYAPLSPLRAGWLCQQPCFTPCLLPTRVSPPLATTLLSFLLGSWFPLLLSRGIFCGELVPKFYVKPFLVPQLCLPTHDSLFSSPALWVIHFLVLNYSISLQIFAYSTALSNTVAT